MIVTVFHVLTAQLEDDHSETQRLLAQERSARTLQENLLNSHLRKQQEIEDESKRNISRSNEVRFPFTALVAAVSVTLDSWQLMS